MAKKNKSQISQLPLKTIIEVKMTKNMEFGEYQKMRQQAKQKGWRVEAFQLGFTK